MPRVIQLFENQVLIADAAYSSKTSLLTPVIEMGEYNRITLMTTVRALWGPNAPLLNLNGYFGNSLGSFEDLNSFNETLTTTGTTKSVADAFAAFLQLELELDTNGANPGTAFALIYATLRLDNQQSN